MEQQESSPVSAGLGADGSTTTHPSEGELLYAIAVATAGEADLERLLSSALDYLGRVVRFTGSSIALVEGDELVVRAARGPFAAAARGLRQRRRETLSWKVVLTGQPHLSHDLPAEGYSPSSPFRSFLAVPLVWRGAPIGLLEVDSVEPQAFTAADQSLLQKVALALSGSVELARRYAAEEQGRRQAAFLADVSALLAESLDDPDTCRRLAVCITPVLADVCLILRRQPDGALVCAGAAHTDPQSELGGLSQHLDPAQAEALLDLAPSARDLDLREPTAETETLARTLGWGGLAPQSALLIPLISHAQRLGLLILAMTDPARSFDPDARRLALDVAERAAITLENTRLYAQAQQAVRTRDDFISIASHELRTPLTILLGHAQMLLRSAQENHSLSDMERRSTQQIMLQGTRLTRMISALLDVSRLQEGEMQLERTALDLVELVRGVVAEFQPLLSDHRLSFQTDEPELLVSGDTLRLTQIFHNLINNAIKYSPRGGPIEVTLRADRAGAAVSVRDEGIGIPAAALEHLHKRFYRAPNVQAQEIAGMGIGLHLVYELVMLHGGSLDVQSEEGRGSTFTVRLPREG